MKPLPRLLLLLLSVVAGGAALRLPAAGVPGDSIVMGVVYNLFHEEYATDDDFFAAVDTDIPAMAAAGFDTVFIFPMSEWDPTTHELRWERTDYLVRKIEETGLKFVPLLFKEEQNSHYFPIWKFQELGLWDERDVDNGNRNNRENVDFADPRIFPLLEEHFAAVIGRYGHSPALSFYNIWNEPHCSSTAPHVVARFRTWLQAKYGSLAALRRAWGDDYSDWSQVSPFLNDDWNSEMPAIDWNLFRNELNGILLGELATMLRRYDPLTPINANPVGTPFAVFSSVGSYNTDTWPLTAHQDFNGASYYPDYWARSRGLDRAPQWFHNLNFTVFRSSAGPDRDYILTELYTNAKSGLTLGGYVDPATARQVAWTALANDCKGLIYWKWKPFRRGRQSLGRGLVNLNGELAPRGEAVSAVAHTLQAHGPLLRSARLTPPEIGVVVDMVGLLKVVQQTAEARTRNFMYESIAGVFQAFDAANLPVDILRADRGDLTLAELQRYKAIVLPFQIVVRRELAATLRAYVEAGGHVLADARTGTIDELDFAYAPSPGAGLIELFGATRQDWVAEDTFHSVQFGDGGAFEAKYFREQLVPAADTTVLATYSDDGSPAMLEHRLGAGRAVLAGVALGASQFTRPTAALESFLVNFATAAGVSVPARFVTTDATLPLIRVHTAAAGDRVVYLVNSTNVAQTGELQLPWPDRAAATTTDLLTDQTVTTRRVSGALQARVALEPRGVAVLHIASER